MNCGEGIAQGVVKATQTGILWSQVQVLVGPPEKQALISNGGGLLFDYDHSGGANQARLKPSPSGIISLPAVLES